MNPKELEYWVDKLQQYAIGNKEKHDDTARKARGVHHGRRLLRGLGQPTPTPNNDDVRSTEYHHLYEAMKFLAASKVINHMIKKENKETESCEDQSTEWDIL